MCVARSEEWEKELLPFGLSVYPPKLAAWHLLDGFLLTAPTPRVWRAHRLQGVLVAFALWRQYQGYFLGEDLDIPCLSRIGVPEERRERLEFRLSTKSRVSVRDCCHCGVAVPEPGTLWALGPASAYKQSFMPDPQVSGHAVCLSPAPLAQLPETQFPLLWTDGSQAPGHVTMSTSPPPDGGGGILQGKVGSGQ